MESRAFWCSQVLDLSLLPLVLSLILTLASRLLHPYCTNDKASRLMVKIFPHYGTPREVHRVTLIREEGGEERDRDDQEKKRGNQNG